MARPAIDRLFDHTVRIWRPVASATNRLGVEVRSYAIVAAGVGAALNRNVSPLQDIGPGMKPIGRRRFYMRADLDIRERDVVEIMTGPDAVQTWEVDQPPTRPRGHHTQVDTIYWSGELGPVNETTVAIAALGAVIVATATVVNPPIIPPKLFDLDIVPGVEIRATGTVQNFQATGGTITEAGGYRIHTFLASGNFQILGGHHDNIEVLLVAGGGGGGGANNGYASGGGGGGGVREVTGMAMIAGTYPVVVGAGGASNTDGGNSSFNGNTATGGGKGGNGGVNGSAGGSGGGGNGGSPSSNGGAGTAGEGFAGGNGFTNNYAGGGGGGSGVGSNGNTPTTNSDGGPGKVSSFSGAAVTYGGGGGGGNHSNDTNSGLGGVGGGGKWHVQPANGAVVNPPSATTNGTANTGGGGGGRTTPNSGTNNGGTGGSGIVIIRYTI